jgi:hypothetical protein
MGWNDWPLERWVILFVALAFLMISVQVTMSHYRQNFHHKAMYAPVIETPIFFIVGTCLVFWNVAWLQTLFVILMWVGSLSGLVGFYYHFHGVGVRVGGWTSRNFLVGPPVVLPVMITALSALALIAVYWR